jgi:hypothetical protein
VLLPLTFQVTKLAGSMNARPTVDISSSGTNLSSDVHSWIWPILLIPARLVATASQIPASVSKMVMVLTWPVLTKRST